MPCNYSKTFKTSSFLILSITLCLYHTNGKLSKYTTILPKKYLLPVPSVSLDFSEWGATSLQVWYLWSAPVCFYHHYFTLLPPSGGTRHNTLKFRFVCSMWVCDTATMNNTCFCSFSYASKLSSIFVCSKSFVHTVQYPLKFHFLTWSPQLSLKYKRLHQVSGPIITNEERLFPKWLILELNSM